MPHAASHTSTQSQVHTDERKNGSNVNKFDDNALRSTPGQDSAGTQLTNVVTELA